MLLRESGLCSQEKEPHLAWACVLLQTPESTETLAGERALDHLPSHCPKTEYEILGNREQTQQQGVLQGADTSTWPS